MSPTAGDSPASLRLRSFLGQPRPHDHPLELLWAVSPIEQPSWTRAPECSVRHSADGLRSSVAPRIGVVRPRLGQALFQQDFSGISAVAQRAGIAHPLVATACLTGEGGPNLRRYLIEGRGQSVHLRKLLDEFGSISCDHVLTHFGQVVEMLDCAVAENLRVKRIKAAAAVANAMKRHNSESVNPSRLRGATAASRSKGLYRPWHPPEIVGVTIRRHRIRRATGVKTKPRFWD